MRCLAQLLRASQRSSFFISAVSKCLVLVCHSAIDTAEQSLIWGYEHFKLSIHLVTVSIILLWVAGLNSLHPLASPLRFIFQDMQLLCKPWAIPLIFASGASLLSGLKSGGNVGNTELAIILLFPFIFMIFRGIDRNVSFAIACILMISQRMLSGALSPTNSTVSQSIFQWAHTAKRKMLLPFRIIGVVHKRNKTGIHNSIMKSNQQPGNDDLTAFIKNRDFTMWFPLGFLQSMRNLERN